MNLPYYFEGSIYGANGCILKDPCIIIDKESGCFHGYGSKDTMLAKYNTYVARFNEAGMSDMASDLVLVEFNDYADLNKKCITYVIRRLLEYTATPFPIEFLKYLNSGDKYAFDMWLRSEMEKIPISIESGEV